MTGQIHDAAWAMAVSITKSLRQLIRDDETRDVLESVYEILRQGLQAYEAAADRLHRRIHPSKN